jgi:hypothetical protein
MESSMLWSSRYSYHHLDCIPTDLIDPTNILKICKEELSSLTIQEIERLSHLLSVFDEFAARRRAPVHEVL